MQLSDDVDDDVDDDKNNFMSRTRFLISLARTTTALPLILTAPSANALVKGNAPPPKKKPDTNNAATTDNTDEASNTKKCRNVEECQEMAERAEEIRMQQEAERAKNGPKPQVAPKGTKYLDVLSTEDGSDADSSNSGLKIAKTGDTVEIHYKVLKLGKRSYDGLSGEGTVVFSRGYALEDDEKVIGDHSFQFTLSNNNNNDENVILALIDAVPGMTLNSTRRISVTPRNGWEKNTPSCDGGPGGSGAGGELKTDYVVVPTATMVDQEACFDRNKRPFPRTYAQERRMAQRFDQSLIMEVRLVNIL